MNKTQIEELDNLTLDLNFDLAVLYNAIKDADEELEVYMLENFVKRIYKISNNLRNIFDNEIF